jgi:hypothetical protein
MSEAKTLLNHRLLCEKDAYCIYHDFVNEWLYVDWIGPQSVETIKEGCEVLLKFMAQERLHKVINDNTRVTNIYSDAAEWVARTFAPRCALAGLDYCAFVYSPDHFSRLSADEILDRHITKTVTIPFNDLASAQDWLRSV